MKKLLIVGTLLVAGPAWAQDKNPDSGWNSYLTLEERPGFFVPMPGGPPKVWDTLIGSEYDVPSTPSTTDQIQPFLLISPDANSTKVDFFSSAPQGKNCVVTFGGKGEYIQFDEGCDLYGHPGVLKAKDPAGALIFRRAQP